MKLNQVGVNLALSGWPPVKNHCKSQLIEIANVKMFIQVLFEPIKQAHVQVQERNQSPSICRTLFR